MPVLDPHESLPAGPAFDPSSARRPARAFPVCANPRCTSGWLQLWRKGRSPIVEGGWLCSPACTRARIEELIAREQTDAHPVISHRHRVPIGLVLLTLGWITHEQLKQALEAQRNNTGVRLGELLLRDHGLKETRLTQALGLQWSCPVFSLAKHNGLPVTVLPRLLPESFGFVPLRLSPLGILYIAFEDRIDHSVTLAVERMTGLRVEGGLLTASEFAQAGERFSQGRFARTRMIEAGSLELLAEAFTRHIENGKPVEARLVRMRDLFWLRLWHQKADSGSRMRESGNAEDVIGAVTCFE